MTTAIVLGAKSVFLPWNLSRAKRGIRGEVGGGKEEEKRGSNPNTDFGAQTNGKLSLASVFCDAWVSSRLKIFSV